MLAHYRKVECSRLRSFTRWSREVIVESKQGLARSSVALPFTSLGQTASGNAPEDHPLLESSSQAMVSVIDSAGRAASTDATILLAGESGTGKSLLARQIHNWSERRAATSLSC
jgi:transcriptional regulator with PAS, ATPase and Fis domain